MASKVIEAILRISGDVAGGVAAMRQMRREANETSAAVSKVGAGGGDAAQAQAAAKAAIAADKGVTENRQTQAKARTLADKLAAAEALAEQKRAAAAQRAAEAAARREAREAEEADKRRRRKEKAQEERDELARLARIARADREQKRRLGQLAPQVTDIATGLASGQNPALVALQQGGQILDVFGGGLQGAKAGAQALLGIFTPMRLLVGGIATGIALWATQILSGYNESERLRKSLALTGNTLGTSLGQISDDAKGVAQAVGVSIGAAREVMEGLLAVQGQTANTLGTTGKAVAAIMRLSGQTAEEATKQFADQAAGVTDWAVKSNKAYNFLNADQVAYIRQLEQQGRISEAIRFTNEQLSQTLVQRMGPALGLLEKAWQGVKNAMSAVLDEFKSIGRDSTPEDKIVVLQRRLDELRARMVATPYAMPWAKRENASEEADLEAQLRQQYRAQLRVTEAGIQAGERQREIQQQSLEFQSALSARRIALVQDESAKILAALDERQSAIELANARGLLSERDHALALAQVDKQRLQEQRAVAAFEVSQAELLARYAKSEEDAIQANARAIAGRAAVRKLDAQIRANATQQQAIIDADALAKSREQAQAWADIWLQADQKIRDLARDNALTAADRDTNPLGRARATAAAQVQELQRQLDLDSAALKLRIDLAVTPEAKAELQRQLDELGRQGKQRVDELTRQGTQQSLSTQMAEQLERVRLAEQAIDAQVQRGALTTEEAEQRKFAAREKALPQLRLLLEAMRALATTDAERNAVDGLVLQLDQLADRTDEVARTIRGSFTSAFTELGNEVTKSGGSVLDKIGNFIANIGKAFQNLINQRLSEQLARSLFGNGQGQGGSLSGFVNWLSNLFVTTKHTGGVVDGGISMGRSVAPWVFAGAQVLHSGGIAGLAPNEQPAILMKGEEVLTADDPRHIKNWRGGGGPVIGNLTVAVTTTGTGSAAGDAQMAEGLKRGIAQVVEQYVVDQMRPGGLLQNAAKG